jgi:hypothetical protein
MSAKWFSIPNRVFLMIGLCIYLFIGINIDIGLVQARHAPAGLLEDFGFYERALDDAVAGKDPYSIRSIGPGYLYPPPALFIVEVFRYIRPFTLKFLILAVINIAILIFMVRGVARYYGYSSREVWYWYVICLGFAPFFELLYYGQINVITLLGILLFFLWQDSHPTLSGAGLSLAILTKVSPLVFFIYLAVTRRIKVMVAAILWTAGWIFLSIFRYGISPTLKYPELFRWLSSQFPVDNNSQSLLSKLQMTFGLSLSYTEQQIFQSGLMLYIALVLLASALLTIRGKQSYEPLFILTVIGMAILPNVMWYHHYVFLLLPFLIWMGWKRLDLRITAWVLLGVIIIQIDRILTFGLLIQLFAHLCILILLVEQARQFFQRKAQLKVKVSF